jgi:hypothetical protein
MRKGDKLWHITDNRHAGINEYEHHCGYMTNICGHSATRNQRFRLFCLEIISVDKKTALRL